MRAELQEQLIYKI